MARWAPDSEVPVSDEVDDTFTLPARYYTDPEVLDAERRQLFDHAWQYVGDARRVSAPGEYLVRDVADRSIVVVRDADGDLGAFHNVCPHRGSRLLDDETGSERMFQCPYHGWTFHLDGTLNAAPNVEEDRLDCEANSLRPVSAATVGPLLFVSLDSDPEPLADYLGAVPEELEPYGVDEFERVRTVEWAVDCNWKVYVDNYLECDHCDLNHPSFVDSLDMENYRIEPHEHYVAQRGAIGADSEMDSAADDHVAESVRDRYFSAWVWPNLTVDVTPRALEVTRVKPVEHDRTVLSTDYYNRSGEPTPEWEEAFAFSSQVMREDLELCERQQAGLESDVFRQGRLAPTEHGVHRFQTLLQERLDA